MTSNVCLFISSTVQCIHPLKYSFDLFKMNLPDKLTVDNGLLILSYSFNVYI